MHRPMRSRIVQARERIVPVKMLFHMHLPWLDAVHAASARINPVYTLNLRRGSPCCLIEWDSGSTAWTACSGPNGRCGRLCDPGMHNLLGLAPGELGTRDGLYCRTSAQDLALQLQA